MTFYPGLMGGGAVKFRKYLITTGSTGGSTASLNIKSYDETGTLINDVTRTYNQGTYTDNDVRIQYNTSDYRWRLQIKSTFLLNGVVTQQGAFPTYDVAWKYTEEVSYEILIPASFD